MPRSSVHGVDGDSGDAAFSTRRGKSPLYMSNLCQPALAAFLIIVLPWYFVLSDQRADFSVQLQQPTTTTTGHITTSSFNGTLHARNGRGTERCYGHGDATVTYGGFTVASARVPGFCVPGKGRREVPFQLVARTDDVGLPEHLRGRAADEAAMVGALELEVQIDLFHDRGGGGTPSRRMWCTARVGSSSAQPPEVAMCTVFAVQNWFDFGA